MVASFGAHVASLALMVASLALMVASLALIVSSLALMVAHFGAPGRVYGARKVTISIDATELTISAALMHLHENAIY